jgi:soluble lytic murein transglycosylase-like protein
VAELDAMIGEKAREHGVDPLLVHSIIHVESGYNPYALSHKGAEGLMQLMPQTARKLGVRSSFDVRQNVGGGVSYLKQMLDRFGDLRLALAAYNAGPEAVARWNGVPPYAETQDYVYKVGKRYGELRRQHQSARAAVTPVIRAEEREPEYRPLEWRVDEQGRLHLSTR